MDEATEVTGKTGIDKLVTDYGHLIKLGDKIAKKLGYRYSAGIEAVQFYLMQFHHWTPAQVRSMSLDDLRFAIWDSEIERKLHV